MCSREGGGELTEEQHKALQDKKVKIEEETQDDSDNGQAEDSIKMYMSGKEQIKVTDAKKYLSSKIIPIDKKVS